MVCPKGVACAVAIREVPAGMVEDVKKECFVLADSAKASAARMRARVVSQPLFSRRSSRIIPVTSRPPLAMSPE